MHHGRGGDAHFGCLSDHRFKVLKIVYLDVVYMAEFSGDAQFWGCKSILGCFGVGIGLDAPGNRDTRQLFQKVEVEIIPPKFTIGNRTHAGCFQAFDGFGDGQVFNGA